MSFSEDHLFQFRKSHKGPQGTALSTTYFGSGSKERSLKLGRHSPIFCVKAPKSFSASKTSLADTYSKVAK